MSALLIHEPPLQVLPSLAVNVGLNEAIILQQIHYWLTRSKVVIQGHRWVYNSVTQWRAQFPFWSDDTIARSLKNLRSRGIVIAEQLSPDSRDRSYYYRIDYSKLPESCGSDAECIAASCGNGDAQVAAIPNRSRDYTETPRKKQPLTPEGEHVPAGFAKFWECYPSTRKVGKKTCLDKWRKKKLESIADTIIQHVEAMKGTRAWKDGFDPSPQTYLAQERWADGVNVATIQDQKFAGVI